MQRVVQSWDGDKHHQRISILHHQSTCKLFLKTVFVQIGKCICQIAKYIFTNCKIYLFKKHYSLGMEGSIVTAYQFSITTVFSPCKHVFVLLQSNEEECHANNAAVLGRKPARSAHLNFPSLCLALRSLHAIGWQCTVVELSTGNFYVL